MAVSVGMACHNHIIYANLLKICALYVRSSPFSCCCFFFNTQILKKNHRILMKIHWNLTKIHGCEFRSYCLWWSCRNFRAQHAFMCVCVCAMPTSSNSIDQHLFTNISTIFYVRWLFFCFRYFTQKRFSNGNQAIIFYKKTTEI